MHYTTHYIFLTFSFFTFLFNPFSHAHICSTCNTHICSTHTHTHTHARTQTHTGTYTQTHTHTHAHTDTHRQTHTRTHTHTHTHTTPHCQPPHVVQHFPILFTHPQFSPPYLSPLLNASPSLFSLAYPPHVPTPPYKIYAPTTCLE